MRSEIECSDDSEPSAAALWREARVEPCLDAREDQLAAAVAALQPNKDGREEAVKR
jgi:phage terminase large subunit-like protein